jgi:hypothetical protein
MTVIIDNTGFSVEHWSRFNEAEFIAQAMRERFFKQYGEVDRRLLLSETYKLINNYTPRTSETAKKL